jgi:hypothetical protein
MLTRTADVALPTCADMVKNGSETATDCGGRDCSACGNSKSCVQGRDCTSGKCIGSVCVP